MNLYVTRRAVGVLSVLVMLRPTWLDCTYVVRDAVARQTELVNLAEPQQPRISRAVWRMTGDTTFGLQRRMFISEWTLFIGVTFNARCIAASCQPRLLQLKTTMRIVAIAAFHCAFENLVMEGHIECGLDLTMTAGTKLWFANLQQVECREAGLFCICGSHSRNRARHILVGCG